MNPIDLFISNHLGNGKQLCLLPMDRIHAEESTHISPTVVYYPPNTLSREDMNVVSIPAEELSEISRRCRIPGTNDIKVDGSDLPWFQSGATSIGADDFFGSGLLAFSIDIMWDDLIAPSSQHQHRSLISQAAEHVELTIDVLRLYSCRIDLPDTLPQFAGLLGKTGFSAALFYTVDDNESYIVSHQVSTHQIIAGLGLEIDVGSTVRDVDHGPVGNIVKHGLRLRSEALNASNATTKFIHLIGLLEYLAEPFGYVKMQDVKKQIGRHVARDRETYQAVLDDFEFLTSKKDEQGQNIGLRHNIIHVGCRLEELLPESDLLKTLIRLDNYVSSVVFDLMDLAQGDWSSVIEFREQRLVDLGLVR